MTVLRVDAQVIRDFGVVTEQEYKPGHARLTRGLELQLGVGQFRPVPHRGSIPEPDDDHVHVSREHRVPAHLLGFLGARGEIRHIPDEVPGPGYRTLRSNHERPAGRQPP